MNYQRLAQNLRCSTRFFAAKAKKTHSKNSKAKKSKMICRYVFPYPKCIDLFSLRPEPHCLAPDEKCTTGSTAVLAAGLIIFGVATYIAYTIPVKMLWYSFDEEDESEE